ncbi:methyltransferase domain-containing protein [Cohnella endophytica]|uniref:Methyltransferase domain-containing protein n=1 Tax=Cohnella endophytica TaxID=2419778 RepID=A0A494XVZ6_9BACL|nr:methyltransferase domain-containing protein [Cohnella endophytica]RKP54025.1 methyltransferase domain-containing protein [Cohnella endophytica]
MTRSNDANQKVHWEAGTYDESMGFVSLFGEELISWLKPRSGERIIDFGCGTGDLAARIAASGADVHGVDISPEMVERARDKYPQLTFECSDVTKWRAKKPYDAVFSNAALHWMKDAEGAAESLTSGLEAGGRLVVELGGYGNVQTIIEAMKETLGEYGREDAFVMPWYFPKMGEYCSLLEKYGLEIRNAIHFDRPTRLEEGEEGMKGWLRMFGHAMFPQAGESEKEQWIRDASDRMRKQHHSLYQDGAWTADYRRLRIYAIKR